MSGAPFFALSVQKSFENILKHNVPETRFYVSKKSSIHCARDEKPGSENRFSKVFVFLAQMDAFLVIFHFRAMISICFTTRITSRFPEA